MGLVAKVSKWMQSAARFHAEMWFWRAFGVLAYLKGWTKQVDLVSFLSIYALVLAAQSAEQGARAKQNTEEG